MNIRKSGSDELLSVPQVLKELAVPRSTYYKWRQLHIGPASIKLPNGQVRVRRSALDAWLAERDEGVA